MFLNILSLSITYAYRFEKKIVNRDVDDSGFCVIMGVFGAEPRRHAFSYDVSASKKNEKFHEFRALDIFSPQRIQQVAT